MGVCDNCKNNCCSKNFIGLVNSFKNNDSNLFNQILLTEEEKTRIVKSGGEKYIEYIDGSPYISLNDDRSCKAFKDGKCLIYSVRPDVCKLYPFYFDPFGGLFIDKNCSCIEEDELLDKEEMFELISNRVKLFAQLEGEKHKLERFNKHSEDNLTKEQLVNFVKLTDYLTLKDNVLYINDTNIMDIVKKYGSPLAVGFTEIIENRILYLKSLFKKYIGKFKLNSNYNYAYATKASYFAEVVHTAMQYGDMLEVSSEYDIELIVKLFETKKLNKDITIICNGFKNINYVSSIRKLSQMGLKILYIINNPTEYQLIKENPIKNVELGVRYDCEQESRLCRNNYDNFDLDRSRFGMEKQQLLDLVKDITNDNFYNLSTFHFHFGGTIKIVEKYKYALSEVSKIYTEARKLCPDMKNFDFGGGFPILFDENGKGIIEDLVESICSVIFDVSNKENIDINLIGEHGRYTAAEHGFYIFKVDKVIEKSHTNWFVINNSLMSYLPDLWAKQDNFVVLPINNWDKPFVSGKISGMTCDESDVFFVDNKNKSCILPVEDKDEMYIIVLAIGAYQEMISGSSAFSHCMIPKADELVITKEKEIFIKSKADKQEIFNRLSYTTEFLNKL